MVGDCPWLKLQSNGCATGENEPPSCFRRLLFIFSGLVLIPLTFLCLATGPLFGLAAVPVIVPSTTLEGIMAFTRARLRITAYPAVLQAGEVVATLPRTPTSHWS